jgi:hypothetical protein
VSVDRKALDVVRKARDLVDWNVVKDVAAVLFDAGHTEDEVVKEISDTLDAAIPFDDLVPAPAGNVIELIDDLLFELIVRPLVKAMRNTEVRSAWKAKRVGVVADRRNIRKATSS